MRRGLVDRPEHWPQSSGRCGMKWAKEKPVQPKNRRTEVCAFPALATEKTRKGGAPGTADDASCSPGLKPRLGTAAPDRGHKMVNNGYNTHFDCHHCWLSLFRSQDYPQIRGTTEDFYPSANA